MQKSLSSSTAFIGFGSNLGDPLQNFETARQHLENLPGIQKIETSALYRSEPLTKYGEFQPWYLNAVFLVETILSPHDLFSALQQIEKQMGRLKRHRWAPRLVDLDILLFEDLVYADAVLTIPHPEMARRKFVLAPLSDLAAEKTHPELGMTLREILHACPDPLSIENFITPRSYDAVSNQQVGV